MGARFSTRRLARVLAFAALAVGCAEPSPPRNVLLIVVDTLRADHLGIYGYERPTSPQLDRRARSAVVFDRAFSTSPWTVPAVASILTGLPPSVHGGGFRIDGAEQLWQRTAVHGEVASLAQRLKRRGFETVAFLSNAFLKPRFGLRRGFDTYQLYKRQAGADFAVDSALAWIDSHSEAPFFMLLHFMEPHAPYAPPEPFRGRFTGEKELRKVLPLKIRRQRAAEYTDADRRYFVGRYDEEIVALDDRLGRLFEGLGERWSDTLIVFVSDHGEELLDHGSFDHGHTMMQELLHVPLLLWAPGLEPRRVTTPVSLADMTPTILDALGLAVEPSARPGAGRSIWGLARGRAEAPQRELVAENLLFGEELKALIRWPYKLVLNPRTGERRLFDLEADPRETDDLAGTLPVLADDMEAALRELVAAAARPAAVPVGEMDEATARELEALGYVD